MAVGAWVRRLLGFPWRSADSLGILALSVDQFWT